MPSSNSHDRKSSLLPHPASRTNTPESMTGTDMGFGERWNPGPPPSLSTTGQPEDVRRRESSVQFYTGPAEETIRRESLTSRTTKQISRRMSSPPPPRTYQRGVSFDTFDNKDATDFSLTLNYKHKDYVSTRRSRTFLCGTDQKDYSEFALEWLIDELVDDGDEIVCLRVVEKDSKIASDASVEQGKYRLEAQKLLDQVIEKNSQEEKAISLIMELTMGRVQDIIQRMIQIYEPAVLIVGTRGRNLGGMQGLLPGSVSKYCLQSSPIPVIVVRPSTKRLKKKKKRMLDPTRKTYNHILEQTYGGHMLDKTNRNSAIGPVPEATDDEAAAVAKAIGLPKHFEPKTYGGPLRRVTSGKSDISEDADSPSPTEGYFPAGYMRTLSPDPVETAMKSPALAALEWSDDEGDSEMDGKAKTNGKVDGVDGAGEGSHTAKVREHKPSFSEDPPWLKAILSKPETPRERRRSSAARRASSSRYI